VGPDALGEAVLARARAGDEEAFREITEPHRRELQLHCYHILGSVPDAGDTVQVGARESIRASASGETRSSWASPARNRVREEPGRSHDELALVLLTSSASDGWSSGAKSLCPRIRGARLPRRVRMLLSR
jgi:hypothetical protein